MTQGTFTFTANVPVIDTYDIAVCGGGPAGVAAALAAGRAGRKVLLIESAGQLGGTGTSGGASRLLGGRTSNNSQWAVKGIFTEVVERLVERGGAVHPESITAEKYNPYGGTGFISSAGYGVPFDAMAMAALLDDMILEAGVDVLFFTHIVSAHVQEGRIEELIVHNKSGLGAYRVKAVVDATGDADIAAGTGCEVVMGRAVDNRTTPATLLFHVDHVWQDALRSEIYRTHSPQLQELVARLEADGKWPFDYKLVSMVQLTSPGTLLVNANRLIDVDATDGRSVSRAMMEGRRDVQRLFAVMQTHFPGFQEARLRSVAPMLGVRESRRIVADYIYSVDDLVKGREFEDTVGFSAYGWDLPDPVHADSQPMVERKVIRRHSYTPIPYRIMLPRPISNLICPGRAVSVERDVLGILRVQAPCYAMGQAAGLAAACVAEGGTSFKQVDTAALRHSLQDAGALVDWPR